MEEKNNRQININRNTLIPIGMVASIIAAVWFIATLTSMVNANKVEVDNLNAKIESMPTRTEFDTMKADISEIKADIKILLQQK